MLTSANAYEGTTARPTYNESVERGLGINVMQYEREGLGINIIQCNTARRERLGIRTMPGRREGSGIRTMQCNASEERSVRD